MDSVPAARHDASMSDVDELRSAGRASPRRAVSRGLRYEDIGPCPANDPLAANEWAHKILSVAMSHAVSDPNLDERARRAELSNLAANMAKLTPLSRLKRAEAVVTGGGHEAHDGPKMEIADATPQPEVAPGAGGSAARRGRPRKRALR